MTQASDPTGTDYDTLPEAIRHDLTFRQWLFMTDSQKATLISDFTTPTWVGRCSD